jgi:hypothetical protein
MPCATSSPAWPTTSMLERSASSPHSASRLTPYKRCCWTVSALGRFVTWGCVREPVHGFQGSERDTVVVSLGIGPEDLGRSLRFVQDPGRFNVMVTRARKRLIIVHSFAPEDLPRGLMSDYFRAADSPPPLSGQDTPRSQWVHDVAGALGGTDTRVLTGYQVAGWTIDVAVGDGDAAIGVECTVHPDGPDAHIERHLTLRRAGWTLTDAFESRWLLRPEEAAATIAARLHRQSQVG